MCHQVPLKDVHGRDVFSKFNCLLARRGCLVKIAQTIPFGFLDYQEQGFHRVEVHQVLDLTRSSLIFLQ